MLPCGSLYSNRTSWDFNTGVITVWDLSDKKENNQFRAIDDMPNQCCKRRVKILWLLVSKATNKSSSKRAVVLPSLSEARISFSTKKKVVSEE